MKEEFIEECWFVYGVRVLGYIFGYLEYHSAGTSGHVEFSWEKAMNPLLIGWVHTHPSNFGVEPSETDNATMRGWVRGRACPMVSGIRCAGSEKWLDYYRKPDGSIGRRNVEIQQTGKFIKGQINII